jgi:hypothetical protein
MDYYCFYYTTILIIIIIILPIILLLIILLLLLLLIPTKLLLHRVRQSQRKPHPAVAHKPLTLPSAPYLLVPKVPA